MSPPGHCQHLPLVARFWRWRCPLVDYGWLAREQLGCAALQAAMSSASLVIRPFEVEGVPLLCDVSSGAVWPLVALPCRQAVFLAIHSIAHPGVRASKCMLASRFVWPGIAADIAAWCKECQDCAWGKTTVHITAEVEPMKIPSRRFSHLHVDLVGPLPTSKNGEAHILTIVDRSTRWVEAVPLSSTTADSCASALVSTWVSRFGVPAQVTSDRSSQFAGAVWAAFCKQVGVKHVMTTAYHPQSNRMVERVHRQLKAALRLRNCSADWGEHLPWVIMGIRVAPNDDTGVSSTELVYGYGIVLPGELQVPSPPITDGALTAPSLPPAAQRKWRQSTPAVTATGIVRVCSAGLLRQTPRTFLQRPIWGSEVNAQVFHPAGRRRGPVLQRGPTQASHRPSASDAGAAPPERSTGGSELCIPQPRRLRSGEGPCGGRNAPLTAVGNPPPVKCKMRQYFYRLNLSQSTLASCVVNSFGQFVLNASVSYLGQCKKRTCPSVDFFFWL
jgi:hypothetical protein